MVAATGLNVGDIEGTVLSEFVGLSAGISVGLEPSKGAPVLLVGGTEDCGVLVGGDPVGPGTVELLAGLGAGVAGVLD